MKKIPRWTLDLSFLFCVLLLAFFTFSCGNQLNVNPVTPIAATPTITPCGFPGNTCTPTDTGTFTSTPTVTSTFTPTKTTTPTGTPTNTQTPSPTITLTPCPTVAQTPGVNSLPDCVYALVTHYSCAGCHNSGTPPNLSSAQIAYASMVNQPAFDCNPDNYVTPNSPSSSVFYLKVAGTSCGGRMPQGSVTFMSPAELQIISDWINNGAPSGP